jgi:hypothetical protein
MRLSATAGPGLRRILRISILREDLGVMAMLVKPDLFSHYLKTKLGNQLFMKVP